MSSSLKDRLIMARRQQFVGRQMERELVQEALAAAELPFCVLYLFGPGGVGKTSLLREFAHMAELQGVTVLPLDGRNLEPSPASFLSALQNLLALDVPEAIFPTLADRNGRFLLLLDTAELLTPLDSWLRDTFLPQLPANTLVVIAARNPPALRWRVDPGWQQVMRVLPLQNLSDAESRALLMRRQIPAREYDAVMAFTHGHPLALSLVADVFAQQPETRFRPEEAPDIIKTLLEQFMQEAPGAHHRAALEACSQVCLLNEPLLGAILQLDDPHPVFSWLRGLSFMDAERRGLFLHDLAREALAADLRWRNPAWQAALHERARHYYMAQFQQGDAREQRRVLSDYIFLHRDNPVIRPYFEWQSTGAVFTDAWRPDDTEPLCQMVRQHEGEASAQIFAYWLERQPRNVAVMRQADGAPRGLLLLLSLDKTTAADRARDPGTAAAWQYLAQHAPLRDAGHGETATLFRFWLAGDTYQAVSPVQSRIFLNMVQYYLITPGLAFTLLPCAEPDFWTAVFGFADLQRLPEADFTIDGRSFGMYGHDWRVTPPFTWLALMAERELGVPTPAAVSPPITPAMSTAPLLVLDEAEFAAAVRDALRDYTAPVLMQENPLLRCRLVAERSREGDTAMAQVKVLQELLRETAVTLQSAHRTAKSYRALHHTYFQPAATQEKAAELLDLPFSTYRRHLRSSIDYLVQQLWRAELGQQ